MQDDLTRAQHYRELAKQLRETAKRETDEKCRNELLELVSQYGHLADKLVQKQATRGGSGS